VAITETNKAVFFLTCIQNIVEGMASVKYCGDSLVDFLQQWGGAVGQMLGLNVGMGKTRFMQIAWSIVMDKEDI